MTKVSTDASQSLGSRQHRGRSGDENLTANAATNSIFQVRNTTTDTVTKLVDDAERNIRTVAETASETVTRATVHATTELGSRTDQVTSAIRNNAAAAAQVLNEANASVERTLAQVTNTAERSITQVSGDDRALGRPGHQHVSRTCGPAASMRSTSISKAGPRRSPTRSITA